MSDAIVAGNLEDAPDDDLWHAANSRLLTTEELKEVMSRGYMMGHEGPYNDDDRWNEWHAMLAFQAVMAQHALA